MSIRESISGNIITVTEHIDPNTQEVTRRLLKDQTATVLFEDLNGGRAVGNLFSTREKMAAVLNIPREGIVEYLLYAIDNPEPCEVVNEPEFREVSTKLDLMKLPIPWYYPEDGGRYITAGVIVTEYEGLRNVSFHRMMIMDSNHIAVRLVPRHLFTIYNMAKERSEELRISICVGARAEVLLAAATSMNFGADELMVASAMCNKGHDHPLRVGRCDNGLLVPADTDYVLEGRITLRETSEGPFVDITGTYDFER